jgi:hypothetical protein
MELWSGYGAFRDRVWMKRASILCDLLLIKRNGNSPF